MPTSHRILTLSLVSMTFALSGCLFISTGPEGGKQSVESPPISLTTEQALAWETFDTESYRGKRDAISFVNPQIGWYGTGKGDLFQTRNGGKTWFKVASKPGTFVRSIAFLDEQRGYIGNIGTDYYPGVTDETPLYETRDAGQSWTAIDVGGDSLKGVCSIDVIVEQRIFQGKLQHNHIIHAAGRVGGPPGILRSIDDGESWEFVDLSDQAAMILDVKFFDAQTGLVFAGSSADLPDANGLILRTEDGGQSWTEVYRSSRPMEIIWKASFPTEVTGYATLQSYNQNDPHQRILKTENGGLSWNELPMVENAKARQFGIGFIDERNGWVGTMAGGFFTSDGGQTFVPAPIARAANKFQIIRDDDGISVFAIGSAVQTLKLDTP